jgi:hypothetical protein
MDELNNVFNELNTAPDDGSGIIFVIFIGVFFIILVSILGLFFWSKKVQRDQEDLAENSGLIIASDPHGIRITTPQGTVTVPTFPGQTTTQIALSIIQQLLLGLGVGVASAIIIRRLVNFLGAAGRALLKTELRASRAFMSNLRSKNAIRALARSSFKRLKNILPSLSTLARVRYGMLWAKALKALGRSEAQITAALTRRLGASVATKVAERAAARAATAVATKAGGGPFMVAELAVAGIGLYLDITDKGGYAAADLRKTSDLLCEKSRFEAEQTNAFITGPENDDGTKDTANAWGFYPAYWGPLDELPEDDDAEGLDGLSLLVEERMFDMMFADDPDPFIVDFLTRLAQRYGTSSDDVESLISATILNDMSQQDYWGLYDRAFDSLCTEKGGTLIDPGGNFGKQCSHSSEAACHAKSPWVANEGPGGTDAQNITYTEWRNRDYFNKNYSPASLPASTPGACIIQDPSYHLQCDTEDICAGLGSQVCGKNEYIRNLGICQNTGATCSGVTGVKTCEHMRKIGSTGDDCPTALDGHNADLGPCSSILLEGQTLRSCYSDVGLNWGDLLFPGGSTILRYITSGQLAADTTANLGALGQGAATTGTAVLLGAQGSGTSGLAGNSQAGLALNAAVNAPPTSSADWTEGADQFFSDAAGGFKDFGISIKDAFTPSGGCFPGSSLVKLEDGSIISMRDLKLGNRVLSQCAKTGKSIYSEVFMWLVREIGIKDAFIKITTENGKTLTLSSQHYAHVNDTLLSAKEIRMGDNLWVHNAENTFEMSSVSRIEHITDNDIISPVTVSGSIIVNDVLASCVTTYEDLLGSSLPTLYFTKKTPPMMIHHWFFKTIFNYFGYRGIRLFKILHAPLYIISGYKLN